MKLKEIVTAPKKAETIAYVALGVAIISLFFCMAMVRCANHGN